MIFDTFFSQLESVCPVLMKWGLFFSFFFFFSLLFTFYVQSPVLCTAGITALNRMCFLLNELTVCKAGLLIFNTYIR